MKEQVQFMEKYKICHMTSVHPSEDIRIFRKECVSIAKAGYEVFLVERGESYDKNGVHIVGVGEIPESRRKRMIQGGKAVYEKALALDCDLYHIHDPELLRFALKLKRKGKKVIFDSHELTRQQIRIKPYLPRLLAGLLSRLYALYENRILCRIDGVIFPCPVNGTFPLPGKNPTFVNNYPRLSELYDQYDPDALKDPDTICTVGSLTYNRGTKHLIKAACLAGCRVLLAGRLSPLSFEKEVLEMAESKNAEFLGFQDRQGVIALLRRARIGVSPLLPIGQYQIVENMPTKVFEYMAMGLPVVLTRKPFSEEMVEKYKFGVCVDPQNTEEFAAAIRDLLDNPAKAHEMGENGRRAVKEVFNWEKEEENLLQLYHTCLAEN